MCDGAGRDGTGRDGQQVCGAQGSRERTDITGNHEIRDHHQPRGVARGVWGAVGGRRESTLAERAERERDVEVCLSVWDCLCLAVLSPPFPTLEPLTLTITLESVVLDSVGSENPSRDGRTLSADSRNSSGKRQVVMKQKQQKQQLQQLLLVLLLYGVRGNALSMTRV
ncbi:hypothetical protein AXG93_2415s1330 [Marchantia polymorpha subsp. ruderalis]|uniref:Uncharacterized protein n=1 Tax=Marchantia polymorpha subsp. ruderalis TaxID=1480154 RepID=A0A176VUS5_MARPO|nr:hypothetical protein AXG93_2415s1330 [Marchantia polymorpha subsp. ruderalis]